MIFIVVSTGHFDPLIEKCNELASDFSFEGQIGSSTVTPRFPHFRTGTPQEIEEKMAEAELVISHAGTGMLSMLYRLRKPTLVVPKQVRYGEMNDGQVELGKKWCEMGMGVLCMDLNDLRDSLLRARNFLFHFPAIPRLGDSLLAEMRAIYSDRALRAETN